MPYQYADQRQDYSDYASGRVFYNLPGHPAFPIRLASEIFQRGLARLRGGGRGGPVTLYDPLCGGAYHLATLAYFHWPDIAAILASDLDPDARAVARRNLALLTPAGLAQRAAELAQLHARYGKASHAAALASAAVLQGQLEAHHARHAILTHLAAADALDPAALGQALAGQRPDLVITDLPYGQQSRWLGASPAEGGDPVARLLAALAPHLSPSAVVAVAAPKTQKVTHPAYRAVEKLRLGLRRVTFLQIQPASH